MRRTVPALPGVTAIAFRELYYPGEQVLDLTPLRFPAALQKRWEGDCLRALLKGIYSCLDDIYQLQPEVFSPHFLLLQTCELSCESVVAQHLDPVLKVTPSEMELEGSEVDGVEDSQKVGKIAGCGSGRSSNSSVEIERVLRRYTSESV